MTGVANSLPSAFKFEEFEFVRVLGEGGFGITYLGWDHNLDKPVAIKEYYPEDWARRDQAYCVVPLSDRYNNDFEWGRERFLAEAKTLAKFNHPNVVKAYRYFEANGTGYIVMEYVEGQPLDSLLSGRATLDAAQVRFILERVASGLDSIHTVDFLHRDIKPANVILSEETGEPILIDFGAARQTVTTKTAALTAIVTPGYGPHEQYSVEGDNQGPWTDIYSLSALGYKALTGLTPPEGNSRFENDTHRPLDEKAFGDGPLCNAINKGLRVLTKERPPTARAWLELAESDRVGSLLPASKTANSVRKKGGRRERAGIPKTIKPKRRGIGSGWVAALGSAIIIVGVALGITEFGLIERFISNPVITTSTANAASSVEPSARPSTQTPTTPAARKYKTGETFSDCNNCPTMVVVPNGRFNMGARPGSAGAGKSEQPVREVVIGEPFAVGQTEVTVAHWKFCLQKGGCLGYDPSSKGVDMSQNDDPIGMIPFVAAESYLSWLSLYTGQRYRLPSEAEWEYAARAGTTTAFWWGDQARLGMANCTDCGTGFQTPKVHEVKRYPPNAFGLYDMHGNVWEWVADCSNADYSGAPVDARARLTGNCSNRIVRGGGFGGPISTLRSANRNSLTAEGGIANLALGFRVVRELE